MGLTVNTPFQSFGESLSYYDGLDMTAVDVELHEWLEFKLQWDGYKQSGIYSVRRRMESG